VWGQVVVALRDDDTVRRRCADANRRTTIFLSVDGGEPLSSQVNRSQTLAKSTEGGSSSSANDLVRPEADLGSEAVNP
jgi:hypothetical protein